MKQNTPRKSGSHDPCSHLRAPCSMFGIDGASYFNFGAHLSWLVLAYTWQIIPIWIVFSVMCPFMQNN